MTRTFCAPVRYLQGAGVLDQLGPQIREVGARAAVVIDRDVLSLLGSRIARSLDAAAIEALMLEVAGPVRVAGFEALAGTARTWGADVVIGIGGGRALDMAKGVALTLDLPFISVPTVASTDAPASSVIAVYDDLDQLIQVLQMRRATELVLVDTAVIAAAPLRFLRAGIGDALSKAFEAEACVAAQGRVIRGTAPSAVGLAMAQACYRLVRQHAAPALQAAADHCVTEDLEALLEAIVLLSALAFENGGLSVAHAMARSLAGNPRSAQALHGEHVAYGLLVQLVLERRDESFLTDMEAFYRQLQLPRNLAGLGVSAPDAGGLQAALEAIATAAGRSPNMKNFPAPVSTQDLVAAMEVVEQRARCSERVENKVTLT